MQKIRNKFQEYFPDFHWKTLKNLGIGKTMLLWFLAISLIPLATLSFINYLYYYQGLNILSKKSLFTTSQLRVNDLNNYFDQAEQYLTFLSEDTENLHLITSLNTLAGKDPSIHPSFFLSAEYQDLNKELQNSFEKAWKLEGLNDIFLIGPDGTILFSLHEPSLPGKNLFEGTLSATLFSKTVRKILSTGNMLFSDLEFIPPGNTLITGILGQPIYDQEGRKLGVLAIQITTERIDRIIQYSVGFGSTAKVYLVGLDLNLRSISEFGNKTPLLNYHEDNEKIRIWQASRINQASSTPEGESIIEEVTYYFNTRNVYVMGLYRHIDNLEKLGVSWALVEEINTDEAHAVARELSTFAKISLVVTTFFVFFISLLITRRFVTPIKGISAWAKQVARGELVNKDIRVSRDEVGEMKHTFNRLVNSLQQYAEVSQSIALGDYTKKVPIRSDLDILGKSMNEMVESFKGVVKQAKAIASGDYSTNVVPRSDQDTLGISLFDMTRKLREASQEISRQDYLKTGLNELGQQTSGERSIRVLTDGILTFLSHYLDVPVGLLFLRNSDNQLDLTATYAYKPVITRYDIGEGVVGQAAKEKQPIMLSLPPGEPADLNIGLNNERPSYFITSPILFEESLLGVIQFGSFRPFNELQHQFLELSLEVIAIAIHTARSRERVEELLRKTQEQANELAQQKEELRQINEELEGQTKALRLSEENLQHQQEELRVINEELEERTKVLELQRDDIRKKNQALQQAQIEIRQKAEELETASKYKSEFLTNMSHELRTPLNSILALSELLASNKYKGLSPDEIEFARVIHSSGKDLLELINDILDLSKVEAGKLEVDMEDLYLEDLEDFVKKTFSPLTDKKGIRLVTHMGKDLPERIQTDPQRALQIIKNLLSNAIKFTEKGSVTLDIHQPDPDTIFANPELTPGNCIAFDVADTGIGIPKEKADLIFEAFQQADGTVSRKFGGTGLGLTISRSLTRLLGGEIRMESEPGKGSTFTLFLPKQSKINPEETRSMTDTISTEDPDEDQEPAPVDALTIAPLEPVLIEPDSEAIPVRDGGKPDKIFEHKKILIVDDDMRNVFVLTKILEEKNVEIVAGRNGLDGLEKLRQNPDTSLVIMDIMMPEMDGYEAMREIRKEKRFARLPIIALTAKAMKGDREKCIQAGANDYLAKPVSNEQLISLLRVWLQK